MLFLYGQINKGFCCKTVNRIAGVCLERIYLMAVGTKILHRDVEKELVETLPESFTSLSNSHEPHFVCVSTFLICSFNFT